MYKPHAGDEKQQSHPKDTTLDTLYTELARFDNGGVVYRHIQVDCSDSDYDCVEIIAHEKAAGGCKVFILPELVEDDPLRLDVFDGAKENKCPDLKIDGVFVEVKTPLLELTDTKISTNIKRGHDQADHIIINLTEHFSTGILYRITKGRFKTHDTLEIVEFRMSGKYHKFERSRVYPNKK